MPQVIRDLLVDKYSREELKSEAKMNVLNKDCVICLYLGKRRGSTEPSKISLNLRNFPLHLDQMLSLGLDVQYQWRTREATT